MAREQYFKKYQRDGIFHFAKVAYPFAEILNCLGYIQTIEQREYKDTPSDLIDYKAFFEDWDEITRTEYKQVFAEATNGEFRILINGRPVG